jgi:2-polyprenyl-3-methyl-5-hydroxy-6-metoxy-1,4-benzoquinol methylase
MATFSILGLMCSKRQKILKYISLLIISCLAFEDSGICTHPLEKDMELDAAKATQYWDANALTWDEAMADGSPFQNELVEPKTLEFLGVQPGMKILDVACGNGQMSRRLARLEAEVTAIDGSKEMISYAQKRSQELVINYKLVDVTKPDQLEFLGTQTFDAVLCNMALMDIAEIKPVFQLASKVVKKSGVFVFSITHPCFDKSVGPHIKEIVENKGRLDTVHSIKVERYLTSRAMEARALPTFPSTHCFFHRPLQAYLNAAFAEGFVLNGIAEPAFPKATELKEHKGWHELSEIPVVFIAKLKK